jgi:hypothetical protein
MMKPLYQHIVDVFMVFRIAKAIPKMLIKALLGCGLRLSRLSYF